MGSALQRSLRFEPVQLRPELRRLDGGGAAWYDSFGISNVEQVDATYPGFGFGGPGGTEIDRFLSVTSFEFVPGIMPSEPPPGKYRVSAVRIRKDLLDDVVFHRMIAYGV